MLIRVRRKIKPLFAKVKIITLTTDFGTRDWFVAAMKGVILNIAPKARIVDVTHEIPAGDIRAGAYALASACPYFPKGTIHVAVIDPGVGGQRLPIAAKSSRYCFIGPDNGVLSLALRRERVVAVRELSNCDLFHHPVSRTFHGRDIFSPVAAHLARGVAFAKTGRKITDFQQLESPECSKTDQRITGEIVYIDRFGNALTNISSTDLQGWETDKTTLTAAGKRTAGIFTSYESMPKGKLGGIFSSNGCLELAMNQDSAAKRFRLKTGLKVILSGLKNNRSKRGC